MSKKIKSLMQNEYKSRFEGVRDCLVISCRGINGNDNNQMRGELLKKNIRVNVVKNSLAHRAFEELGMGGIGELFQGPCAIAYGGDSIVDVAKEMVGWAKKLEALEIKGCYLEGKVLSAPEATALSKMPSRAELQGRVVQMALSPGSNLVGAMLSPGGTIAGCLKTLVERMEKVETLENSGEAA